MGMKTKMSCFVNQWDKQLFTNYAFARVLVSKVTKVLIFKTKIKPIQIDTRYWTNY